MWDKKKYIIKSNYTNNKREKKTLSLGLAKITNSGHFVHSR